MADGSDKSHLRVTTDLQVFGMIVTAEPYAAVRSPSDVVVLENTVRPETIGSTEPIRANVELLPRGTYTYNVPADLHGLNNAPKVSMDQYEQLVEIYQAQNAVKIAQAQGADQYAPEVITKAERELSNAQKLHSSHAGRSMVVTAARTAAQTAEDARALTIVRKQEAQTTQARDQVEREQRLRQEAEARAQQASAQADADRAALDNAKAQLAAAEARAAALSAPAPAPPPPNVEPPISRQTLEEGRDQRTMAARTALLQELRGALGPSLEIMDASRGVVVTLGNTDFRGSALNQSTAAELLRLAAPVMRTPGLTVEVDGYTDLPGEQNETIASQRAEEVREALVRGGISGTRIVARGMGSSHPLGSNASAAGREQNRRVEIVIAGSVIGNFPLWDKTYALSSPR
jgi:outer membrane protein OmpA-like peptidoglycan-associated protein